MRLACWFRRRAETVFSNVCDGGEAIDPSRAGVSTRDVCATHPNGCAMTSTLQLFLIISTALFSIGLLAALSRRHAIFILIGIELMLAAANLNFIAFWRFSPEPQQPTA